MSELFVSCKSRACPAGARQKFRFCRAMYAVQSVCVEEENSQGLQHEHEA